MKKAYSDQFKLSVILDYYQSESGIRMIARKYGLPSKNYITRWEESLKKKGLLKSDSTKPFKTLGRANDAKSYPAVSMKEKQYMDEISALKAKVAYLESLDSLQLFLKKTKNPSSKIPSNCDIGTVPFSNFAV